MQPISKTEIYRRTLLLLARFQPDFVQNDLIPEIEQNSKLSDIIAEKVSIDVKREICLCSHETLWANYEKDN